MRAMDAAQIAAHEKKQGRGAAWGEEDGRAVVRVVDLHTEQVRNYATGLRNCSGLAMQPGDFFAWPWYYLGAHEDPALKGKRPDLKAQVRTPDVLLQAHSSALSIAFYDQQAFPAEYRGDAFVALHGSHSRPERTGYKVVRVRMNGGAPTGEYVDFMTGFLLDDKQAWGRPASVAVTRDGALLVSDDANGTVFRVKAR